MIAPSLREVCRRLTGLDETIEEIGISRGQVQRPGTYLSNQFSEGSEKGVCVSDAPFVARSSPSNGRDG